MKQLFAISNLLIKKKNDNDNLIIKDGKFKTKHAINIQQGYKFKQNISLISNLNKFTIECWINIVTDYNTYLHPLLELWSNDKCVFHVEYCSYRQNIHINDIEFYPKDTWLYGRHNEWHYLSIVFDNGNIKRYWDCNYISSMSISDNLENIDSIQVGNFVLNYHGTENSPITYYKDIAIDDLILITDNTEISTKLPILYKGAAPVVFLDKNSYIYR